MVINNINSKRNYKKNSIKMVIDLRTFDILCKYSISTSSYLRTSHLINLQKLVYGLDPNTYENDIDKSKRVKFIKKALEARIDYKLNNKQFIVEHIRTGLDFDIDFIDLFDTELSADELNWVQGMVSESLQYFFVYDDVDAMLDLCTRIKSSDYSHRGNLIKEFEGKVDYIKNQFRAVKTDSNLTDMMFSLKDDVYEKSVREVYDLISNPSRRLKTGMQGLNEMLAGGFESGRVYMLLGITGVGKSVTLLNILYQLKKYNRFYKPKDPTKTPAIVLLTMENTVVETITRLFDMVTDNSIGMINYSFDEVMRKLREEGELRLTDDSPIDIVIRYKANRSVDTGYLYTLCDELEDNGYEIICLIQDHVKRIRSIYGSPDLRIELGDIVNEFKVFAAEKDIPVITNSHLNRDAARTIEEDSAKKSRTDVTMRLGKANAGESLLMLDNLDGAIIINTDFDEENNKYMAFKKAKMREKTTREYFLQPFVYGSSIRMVEDFGTQPQFKESLHMNMDVNRIPNVRTSSANVFNNINNIVMENKNSNPTFGVVEKYVINGNEEEFIFDNNEEDVVLTKPNIIRPIILDMERIKQIEEEKNSQNNKILDIDSLNMLEEKLKLTT